MSVLLLMPQIFRRTLFLCLLSVQLTHAQLVSDDFRENSLGWIIESRAGNFGVAGSSIAEFGFDYSQVGIPEAPHSKPGDSETLGLRLRTNLSGFSEDQIAASLQNDDIAGRYQVQVDMWLNWAPDPTLIGTTLHGGISVGKGTESNPVEGLSPVQQGAGILLSTDGDCTNCDFILLKNEAELDLFSGQYSVGFFNSGETRNQPGIDNTDVSPGDFNDDGFIDAADFTAWRDQDLGDVPYEQWSANFGNQKLDMPGSFPGFDLIDAVGEDFQPIEDPGTFEFYRQPTGAAGFQWVTVTADVDPTAPGTGDNGSLGTVTYSITPALTGESILIGTIANSIDDDPTDGFDTNEAPVDLEGQISLVLIDFFSGGPADAELGFSLFDNLVVTTVAAAAQPVPEPCGGLTFTWGIPALLIIARRRPKRHNKN